MTSLAAHKWLVAHGFVEYKPRHYRLQTHDSEHDIRVWYDMGFWLASVAGWLRTAATPESALQAATDAVAANIRLPVEQITLMRALLNPPGPPA